MASSLSARLAVGILVLPLVVVAADATGSYALAGVVDGAWVAGVAVSDSLASSPWCSPPCLPTLRSAWST